MTHYRQPINWTQKSLYESKRQLDKWYQIIANQKLNNKAHVCTNVLAALKDDLNTPKAISALHELYNDAVNGSAEAAQSLKASAQFIGLLNQNVEDWFAWKPASINIDEAQIDQLIEKRNAARASKDFKEADRIRDELSDLGVVLKDGPEGTTWSVVVNNTKS